MREIDSLVCPNSSKSILLFSSSDAFSFSSNLIFSLDDDSLMDEDCYNSKPLRVSKRVRELKVEWLCDTVFRYFLVLI